MLLLLAAVAIAGGAESRNILANGSFENPSVPAGQGYLPSPEVQGWNVSGVYWGIYTAGGGAVSPIPNGANQLYLYAAAASRKACKIEDYSDYGFSVKIAANDIPSLADGFISMEAVSPDGSRVYELDKTSFASIDTPYVWRTLCLSYANTPASHLAGYDLLVRIYAAGMLNIDDAILTVKTERIVIDDFESYEQQSGLEQKWVAVANAGAALESTSQDRFIGGQSMKLSYNIGGNDFAEVQYDMAACIFGGDFNQSVSGELSLSFWGNRANTQGGCLYVKLQDDNGEIYAVDSNFDLRDEDGRLLVIDINRFSKAGLDTANIRKLIIGVKNPNTDCISGTVYIDNIELPAQSRKISNPDLSADGNVNIDDLIILADNWLAAY